MEMTDDFLAVYTDGTFKIYESNSQALLAKPLFVAKCYIHSDNPTWTDPNRKKYSFKIVDENNEPYSINCDGWRIISIIKYFYYNSHTEIKISAPDGEIRMIDTGHSDTLESIAELIKFINEFRGYKDWSYYELKQENFRLTKENTTLSEQLKELNIE